MPNKLERFFRENRKWLAILTAVAFAAYGYEIFSFNLTIDEELYGAAPTLLWLGDGRWMMWLLNWILLPTAAVPTLPILIGLAGIISAIVVSLRMWIPIPISETILAACVALTLPIFIFNLAFSINAYGIGAGFLATIIGARLAGQPSWQLRAVSVLLLTLSFAIYQAFVLVAITALLALATSELSREPRPENKTSAAMRRLVYSLMVIGVATVVYLLTSWGVREVSRLWFTPRDYIAEQFFHPSLILEPWIWRWTAESIAASYAGLATYYPSTHWSLGILMTMSVSVLLWVAISRSETRSERVVRVVLIAATLFVPFSLYLISGPSLPTRALLALPVAVLAICALALQAAGKRMRLVLSILAGLTAFHNAAMINRYTATSEMSLAIDRALGAALLSAIHQMPRDRGQVAGPTRIAVVGAPLRKIGGPAAPHDIFGASFFAWSGGDAQRAVAFLETLGLENAIGANDVDFREIIRLQASMPHWPNAGSVFRSGDLVIVKFGEFTRGQKSTICGIIPGAELCHY